jgi:tetratricopeptide (TPR) repeat protein
LVEQLHDAGYFEALEETTALLVKRIEPKGHYDRRKVLEFRALRAEALHELGRLEEAEALLRSLLEANLAEYGPDEDDTFDIKCRLAVVLDLRGKTDEAEQLGVEIRDLGEFREAVDLPFWTLPHGRYLTHIGDLGRAETCLHSIFVKRVKLDEGSELNPILRALVALYEAGGSTEEAERYRELIVKSPPTAPTP